MKHDRVDVSFCALCESHGQQSVHLSAPDCLLILLTVHTVFCRWAFVFYCLKVQICGAN